MWDLVRVGRAGIHLNDLNVGPWSWIQAQRCSQNHLEEVDLVQVASAGLGLR